MKHAWYAALLLIIVAGLFVYWSGNYSPNTDNTNNGEPDPAPQPQTRTIQLYYYNESRDLELGNGNPTCGPDAVLPVTREVPQTNTPIQDSIRELLAGRLTAEETAQGFATEFPLEGLELTGANLAGGELVLEFADPNNLTTGGSCRVSILWNQIAKTARQFEGVTSVRFQPDELFQP